MFPGGLVTHFPNANIRMGHGNIRDRRKVEIKELAGDPEDALAQLLELQVWFDFVLVQIEFRLAHFLHVVTIIPWFDLDLRAFLVGERLHVCNFLVDARDRRLPNGFHQLHRLFRSFCHRILETPVRVCRVAEQLRAFGAQLKNLGDDRVVVVFAAVVAAIDEHAPRFFTQIATI